MTIIGAKQIKNKWTLFTDDCVTIGQSQIRASKEYRPKLKQISGKNYDLIIASCGGTKDVDLILNLLEAKLEISKIKDTISLGYVIQTTLVEAWKTLKDIANDPSVGLIILEVNSNTLWLTDDYSVFQPQEDAEIVSGSGEQAFFQAKKYKCNFCECFMDAVITDEYCDFPIYVYRDGKIYDFWSFQNGNDMYDVLAGNCVNHDNYETEGPHKGGDIGEVCNILSGGGLSYETPTKLG